MSAATWDAWRVDFGVPRPVVELLGAVDARVLRGRVVLDDLDAAAALLGRCVPAAATAAERPARWKATAR